MCCARAPGADRACEHGVQRDARGGWWSDNSAGNWRNPNNPPKQVSWGEQTTDKMCVAFLGFTIDAENLATGQTVHPDRVFGQVQ